MSNDQSDFTEAFNTALDAYVDGKIDLNTVLLLRRFHRRFHRLQSFNETLENYLESKMAMQLYRKKPVEFEAIQWYPNVKHHGVKEDTDRKMVEFMAQPPVAGSALWDLPAYYVITIHEQRAYLVPGDYICPEPKEMRFYPCKPDIFEANNEPVT